MRIAVIGLGFMGSTHLKAYKNVPGAEIVAVCSTDPQKLSGDLSSIQGNLGGPGEVYDFSGMGRYTDVDELLRDPHVEAVDICLPTHLHASTALAALRAGKHVLVEKPMALKPSESDEILAEAERSGRILMVGQVLRFLPAYRGMADAIRTSEYGKVRSALFRRRCAAPFWSKWLGDPARSGGGVFDLLIHDVDFALYLFGMPESYTASGYEDLPAGIDTLNATLHYGDGLPVLVTGGWHHKKAYPFSMEFTVVTDGGTFEYNSMQGPGVTVYGADGEARPLTLPDEDPFEAELRYFVACCEKGEFPSVCPPGESAEAVKLALQLVEARRSGAAKAGASG